MHQQTVPYLEYLYELAKCKKALICGGSSCDYINGIMKREGIRKERNFIENQYVKKEDYPGIAGYWAFIFQKEFLLKNNIFFPIIQEDRMLHFLQRP